MDLDLTDRVYLVTGGSRGLGRACAQVLVDEGARVVLGSRNEASAQGTAAAIGTEDRALGIVGDLADPASAAGYVNGSILAVDGGASRGLSAKPCAGAGSDRYGRDRPGIAQRPRKEGQTWLGSWMCTPACSE